jgi:large subunit ribosomal protein L29
MEYSEIKELTTKELLEKLDNSRELLVRMKLNHTVSPLDNPNKIRETKKVIARLKTELHKRELENKA